MRGGRDAKNVEHNSAIFSPAMLILWLLTYNAVHANLNLWVMHVHCTVCSLYHLHRMVIFWAINKIIFRFL